MPSDEGERPTVEDADRKLRPETGRVWNNASEAEKEALYNYTWNDYGPINSALREGYDPSDRVQQQVRDITNMLRDSSLKTDMWVQRGVEANKNMFGIDFNALSASHMAKLEGTIVQDKGFLSCGIAKGTGMTKKDVIFNIYCPKGTKGIYVEPISYVGNGDKLRWDGLSPATKGISKEAEIVLQRGTKFRVTKIYRGEIGWADKWFVDLEVVGQ